MGECKLPSSFDWRNVHGENWNSPPKHQGIVASCTSFSSMGAIEASINLYYNRHLDIDLSEQALSSCSEEIYSSFLNGSWENAPTGQCYPLNTPSINLCKAAVIGFPDEECMPYVNDLESHFGFCNERKCSDFENRLWKITDYEELVTEDYYIANWARGEYPPFNQELINENLLREKIITNGPIATGEFIEGHSILLVGWNENNWIFKNSYGPGNGEEGYVYVPRTELNSVVVGVVKTPIIPPPGVNYQISCVDKDNDGFCNWGISENMPSTCPSFCRPEKDWDDSDSNVGALGLY